MSETENQQQWADQVQLERELEEAFKDIEDGIFLTDHQIDLLRYACGLPKKQAPHPALKSLFEQFGHTFGAIK
jgi:hypothetical protein